jgi:putative peptidoglycan lipid II flippase
MTSTTAQPSQPSRSDEQARMRSSAAGFAVLTFFSRIAGMVREIGTSAIFGVTPIYSAFTIAFQLPNLIRAFVADVALNASIVPVFTDLNEQDEKERAWRVASTMISLILLVLIPVSALCVLAAPWIMDLVTKDSFSQVGLAVDLFRIMLPIVVLMALNGVVVSILNAYDHFSMPALAPVLWNFVVIAGLLFAHMVFSKHDQIYVYTIGIVVGTVVQVLLPVPWLRGKGGRITAALAWKDPAVRLILMSMVPITVSLVLINLNLVVNASFATHVAERFVPNGVGPATLDKAFRLYMMPQGIISVAISTVFFPALARYATRMDMDAFRSTVQDGLKQLAVLLAPTGVLLAVLAEPTVHLLYERGKFTPEDTPRVAAVLAAFCAGLVFNGASLLLIRAFFSLKRATVPLMVGAVGLVLNVALVWWLSTTHGVTGIAAATSIGNVVICTILYIMLGREIGKLETVKTLIALLQAAVASAVVGAAGWGIFHGMVNVLGEAFVPQALSLMVAMGVSGGLYLLAMARLGVIRSSAVTSLLKRRRRNA